MAREAKRSTFTRRTILRLFAAVMLAAGPEAPAATGTIAGKAIDTTSGRPLVGATIRVAGLNHTGTTDLNGAYRIAGVPAGTRNVTATKDGFQPLMIHAIAVDAGEIEIVEVPLAPADHVLKMEVFSVSAETVADSEIGLLGVRQKAVAVSDAIGSEQLSRLAVGNAAEAMSKLTGASLVDGKYAVIRGLGDRYTYTQMNGLSLPSADPDRRAVQLDQLPGRAEIATGFMRSTVLIVDDEPDGLEVLGTALRQAGYAVLTASNGTSALRIARTEHPDAIILDVMLPDMDGYEVCRMLRRDPATAPAPIVMLSARTAEVDRIVGLELGADDYVTKPFSPRELVVRIRKLLSRTATAPADPAMTRTPDLAIDLLRHEVTVQGRPVELTMSEFKLLALLVHDPDRIFSRADLLQHVWQLEADATSRTVDTHMCRLRDKLGTAAHHLQTVRGMGYRFQRGTH